MTEYNDSYNWRRAWLGSEPPQRITSDSETKSEPFFQHKRFYNRHESSLNVRDFFTSNTAEEDPYLLIHGRSKSAMAYPNIMRRRPKSAPRQSSTQQREQVFEASRPKSDEMALPKQTLKHPHGRNHKKSRSRSKEHRPIDRWPELKVDLPQDSPVATQTNPEPPHPPSPQDASIPKVLSKKPKKTFEKITEYGREFTKPDVSRPRRTKSATRSVEMRQQILTSADEPRTTTIIPRRFQSEYRANYTDLSAFANVARVHSYQAKQNAMLAESSHFSQRHFSQLDSDAVEFWDPPGSYRSEIVGVDKELRAKRLEEYRAALTGRLSPPITQKNQPISRLCMPLKRSVPTVSRRYEPQKYAPQTEPKISILPLERDIQCSPGRHVCNSGGSSLLSSARPIEPTHVYTPIASSTSHSPVWNSLSRKSMDTHLSIAERTLDRATQRRNRLLISTCRN